jgi:hypothetical protein
MCNISYSHSVYLAQYVSYIFVLRKKKEFFLALPSFNLNKLNKDHTSQLLKMHSIFLEESQGKQNADLLVQ